MSEVLVDIVVCVHDALVDATRCLQAVVTQTTFPHRLIIVNDGSGEQTTAALREFARSYAHVCLLENDAPLRYTRAANQGICHGGAPNVVLLNSDTVVGANWIENLLATLSRSERVGLVGPLSNAAAFQSVPDVYDQHGAYAINALPPGMTSEGVAELVARHSLRLFPATSMLNGFCLMFRRELVSRIGLLDEETFPCGYGEETDLCIRAAACGYHLLVADQTFVFHAKSRSYGTQARDVLAHRGRQALHLKHGAAVVEAAYDAARSHPAMAQIREHFRSLLWSTSAAGP